MGPDLFPCWTGGSLPTLLAAACRRTLCHEMCHVAAWLLDHTSKPPHGAVFKKWADRAMSVYPDLEVTTCHNYQIFYPHNWQASPG